MTGKETVTTIIGAVKEAQDSGVTQIDTNKLLDYLKAVEADEGFSHETHIEILKTNHQLQVEEYKHHSVANIEIFKSVITTGANAAKAILIINGGGAISLLAFLGNIWTKSPAPEVISSVAFSLLMFGIGVLLAGMCSGFTYAAQYCYGNSPFEGTSRWKKWGHGFSITAISFGVGSFLTFGWGVYLAYASMAAQFLP